MEDTPFIEGSSERGISRRALLKRSAVAGVGVTTLAGLSVESAGARSECGRHRSLGLASRQPRGDGRLQPARSHRDGLLQAPQHQRQAERWRRDQATCRRSPPANRTWVTPRPGVLTASVEAGVPVTSVWEHDPEPGVRLRPSCGQQDQEPAAAAGEDDRPVQHRLEGDRRPDAGGGRSRPEDRQVPGVRPTVEPSGRVEVWPTPDCPGRASGRSSKAWPRSSAPAMRGSSS